MTTDRSAPGPTPADTHPHPTPLSARLPSTRADVPIAAGPVTPPETEALATGDTEAPADASPATGLVAPGEAAGPRGSSAEGEDPAPGEAPPAGGSEAPARPAVGTEEPAAEQRPTEGEAPAEAGQGALPSADPQAAPEESPQAAPQDGPRADPQPGPSLRRMAVGVVSAPAPARRSPAPSVRAVRLTAVDDAPGDLPDVPARRPAVSVTPVRLPLTPPDPSAPPTTRTEEPQP